MNTTTTKLYFMPSSTKRMLILCIIIFFIAALGTFSLFFFPDKTQSDVSLAVLGTIVFGGFSIYFIINLKRLPTFSLSIDEQGIWPAHLPREKNLIYWSEIAECQHAKPFFKCMYLLGSNNQKLVTIHYQVERFDELADEIYKRTNIQVAKAPVDQWENQRKQGLVKFAIINGSLSWGVIMLIAMAHTSKPFQQGLFSAMSIKYCITWLGAGFVYGVFIWFLRESRYKKQVQGTIK
ncbi:hypothetical protein L4C34_07500 [Vibrio profundum]|uniref:hypothetical protein n=1 Tax=Vibrio profundum TaxID=2910247 RepID=UPI003D0D0BE2